MQKPRNKQDPKNLDVSYGDQATSTDPEMLLPTSQIIQLAKEGGVDFGPGDPNERIRYFVKLGILPHAVRLVANSPSSTVNRPATNDQRSTSTVGHLPYWCVSRLMYIDRLYRRGISYPKIAEKIRRQDAKRLPATRYPLPANDQPIAKVPKGIYFFPKLGLSEKDVEEKLASHQEKIRQQIQSEVTKITTLPGPQTASSRFVSAVKSALIVLLVTGTASALFLGYQQYNNKHKAKQAASESASSLAKLGEVLAASSDKHRFYIDADTEVSGTTVFFENITAPNIVYSVTGGTGISVTGGQRPVVSLDSTEIVTSVNDTSGALTIKAGSNTTVATSGSTITISNSASGISAEADTLSTVTGRGASTSTAVTFSGGETLGGNLTLSDTNAIFNISNGGTLAFKDGTSTLLTVVDSGTYGTLRLSDKASTGDPATCTAGDIYFNGTDTTVKACTATNSWEALDSTVSSMTFTLSGDSGTDQTIADTNTLEVAGGTGITTAAGATDTLTVTFASTEVGSTTWGTATGTVWTFDASAGTDTTIAFGNNTQTFTTDTFTITDGTNNFLLINDIGSAADTTMNILSEDTTGSGLDINLVSISSTGFNRGVSINNTGIYTTTYLLELDDQSAATVTDGILFTSGFSFTDAIDASDAEITNALNVGANTITGTNYTIAASGGTLTLDSTTISATNTTAFNCTDCLDFDDMEDTLDLDADLTVNLGNSEEVTINVDTSFGGINGWTFNGTAANTFDEAVVAIQAASTNMSDASDAALLVRSNSANALANGILITANGTITDAIDISDTTGITNALNVGANTITGTAFSITTTTGDLTLNSADEVVFGDTDTLIIGGHAGGVAYNVLSNAGGSPGSASIDTDNDLFVQGSIEVDGASQFDGTVTVSDLTCTDCLDFDDFEDTLDLDAALTLNQATNTWTQNFTGTTTTGFTYNANSLTTGTAVSIASTSAAGTASDSSYLLKFARSGANANTAHNAYGIYGTVTNTNATSGTNIAAYLSASGATTANYALYVAAGNVNIQGLTASQVVLTDANKNLTTATATAANTCSDCLIQVPLTTGRNTVTPTANSVVALTLNGTSGTATTALNIIQGGDANSQTITANSTTSNTVLDISANGLTTGSGIKVTSTGTITTGGELLELTANTLSTGSLATLSATALTSGTGITFTGPSGATAGITGSAISLTSDLGNAGELLNIAGTIDTTTTAHSAAGISNVITHSSALATTVSQTHYGIFNTLTKTGADTTSGTIALYGTYSTASNTGGDTAGTRNTYGGYFSAVGDLSGTSKAYGIYAQAGLASPTTSTADVNFGVFGYGLSADTTTNNKTVYGVYGVASNTGSTGGTQLTYGLTGSATGNALSGAVLSLIVPVSTTTTINSNRSGLTSGAASGQANVVVTDGTQFAVNDLVLIVQMKGTGIGTYEEATIQSIATNTLTMTANLTNSYSDNGTTNAAQVVKIQRYQNVTVNGTLNAPDWDGQSGGVLYFKASDTVTVATGGIIDMNSKGFTGAATTTGGAGGAAKTSASDGDNGTAGTSGAIGEGQSSNGGTTGGGAGSKGLGFGGTGGTGGGGAGGSAGGGGGGGYGTAGTAGSAVSAAASGGKGGDNSSGAGGAGGSSAIGSGGTSSALGAADLSASLIAGSGGGAGASGSGGGSGGFASVSGGNSGAGGNGGNGGAGGDAGGIVVIKANAITNSGTIRANGVDGSAGTAGGNGGPGVNLGNGGGGGGAHGAGGGGGSGGAIWLSAPTVTNTSGTVTATAGSGGGTSTTGGNGGACTAGNEDGAGGGGVSAGTKGTETNCFNATAANGGTVTGSTTGGAGGSGRIKCDNSGGACTGGTFSPSIGHGSTAALATGSSTAYGLFGSAQSADNNYGLYLSPISTANNVNYGIYFDTISGAPTNNYGIYGLVNTKNSGDSALTLLPSFTGAGITSYGIYLAAADATTAANTDYGLYATLTPSGNLAANTAGTYYGLYGNVAKTGTDTANTSNTNTIVIGTTGIASNTASTDDAEIIRLTYGGYFSATGTTAGTASAYGVYTSASGADTNFGLYGAATSTAGTANYGIYLGALSGATTSKGIEIGALSSATSTGIDIGAFTGATTNTGINIASFATGTTSKGIVIGTNSSATATGVQIGALSGATANTGISIGAISGTGATGTGISIGNISTTGTANAAISLGTLTGGTSSNYQLNAGNITAIASATNAFLNLGTISGTAASSNNYGINIGAISSTGTANFGINLGAISGAATTNYGLLFGQVSGATNNYGIYGTLLSTTGTNDAALLLATTNTATTGNASFGIYNTWTSSAIVTGTAQTAYGIYNTVTKTGADTSSAATTLYGTYSVASNTGSTDAGTKNTFGGFFRAVADTAGTSNSVGVYAMVASGDNVIGLRIAATPSTDPGGTTAYGIASFNNLIVSASSYTGTVYGLYNGVRSTTAAGDGTTSTITTVYGNWLPMDLQGNGTSSNGNITVTNLRTFDSVLAFTRLAGSGTPSTTVTDYRGLNIQTPTKLNTTGTITNGYGVYLNKFDNSTITYTNAPYGVYIGNGASEVALHIDATTTTGAASTLSSGGVVQINTTSLTSGNAGVYSNYTSTVSTATATQYGIYNNFSNASACICTSVTAAYYGQYGIAAKSGADNLTTAGTTSIYGAYVDARNTSTDVGSFTTSTRNTYGGYFTATGAADGTTTAYGVVASAASGDTNYPFYMGTAPVSSGTAALCWDASGESPINDCSGPPVQDYSEIYSVENGINYGDVVVLGTQDVENKYIPLNKDSNPESETLFNIKKLVKSSIPYQDNIIGIVSNNWGDFTSTGHGSIKDADNPMPVALSGRVPIKVSGENGPIQAGDLLTSSSAPGVAMKADPRKGTTFAKALADFSGPATGEILALIQLDNRPNLENAFVDINLNAQSLTISNGAASINSAGNINTVGDVFIGGQLSASQLSVANGNFTVDSLGNVTAQDLNARLLNAESLTLTGDAQIGGNLAVSGQLSASSILTSNLQALTASDLTIRLGDSAGVNNLTIKQSNNSTILELDSAGKLSLTAEGAVLTLPKGYICVNDDGTCTVSNPQYGVVYANAFQTNSTADLAEAFPTTDDSIEAGDVVVADPENPEHILVSQYPYQPSILGIISTEPGITLNAGSSGDEDSPRLALAGRVPTKVSAKNGPVKAGDFLTSSDIPGVAMRADKPGRTIGIALEGFNPIGCHPEQSEGSETTTNYPLPTQNSICQRQIVVFVEPGWYIGSALANGSLPTTDYQLPTSDTQLADMTVDQLGRLIDDGKLDGQILTAEQILALVDSRVEQRLASLESTNYQLPTTYSYNAPVPDSEAPTSASPEATAGAQLAEETGQTLDELGKLLATTDLSLNTLTLTGNTRLAQTQVAGTFSQDGTLIIDYGRQINVLGSTLYLQNDGLAGGCPERGQSSATARGLSSCDALVDIGAGAVTIDKEGSLILKGTLTADGVTTKELTIDTSDPNYLTAGSSRLTIGDTRLTIFTTALKPNAKVLITPTGPTGGKVLYVADKSDYEGFTISLENGPAQQTIGFDWLIVNTSERSQVN